MIPLHDDNPTRRFPIITALLIAANAWVFFAWQLGQAGLERSVHLAGFVPAEFRATGLGGEGPAILTSMFMHGGLMHLLGNMWFLYLFGNNVEDACGRVRFLAFYLLAGAFATLAYFAFNQDSAIPLVGASGAISGVLGAYLLRWPHARLLVVVPILVILRFFWVPAWLFILVWIGFQLLSQWAAHHAGPAQSGGGIAFLAHIAGFAAGILLLPFFRRTRR